MALRFKKQSTPATDPDRGQIYEDIADGRVKIKNSSGLVIDLQQAVEASVFGNNYQSAEKLPAATTSSSSLIDHLIMNTPTIPAGTYLVSFYYNWGYSSTINDFRAEVLVDGNIIMEHREEPKDTDTNQQHVASGTIPVTFSSSSNHEIKLMYGGDGSTARIRNVRLIIWRAS